MAKFLLLQKIRSRLPIIENTLNFLILRLKCLTGPKVCAAFEGSKTMKPPNHGQGESAAQRSNCARDETIFSSTYYVAEPHPGLIQLPSPYHGISVSPRHRQSVNNSCCLLFESQVAEDATPIGAGYGLSQRLGFPQTE